MEPDPKEFVAENLALARDLAGRHFGVSPDQLDLRVLSERMEISGLRGRVLVLASLRADDPKIGPTGEFVRGVLERMRIRSRIRISEEEQGGEIVISLRGDGVRELTRPDARALDALSHLAGRAAQKLVGNDAVARVQADGAGTPGRPQTEDPADARLTALARGRAEEVLRTGKPLELAPMNSRERWVVHNALKEMPGLRSESVGDGRDKRVKISPA